MGCDVFLTVIIAVCERLIIHYVEGEMEVHSKNLLSRFRHPSFYCASLYCTSQTIHFLHIEGLWQLYFRQIYQHHFSNRICLLPVCHILLIFEILQKFYYYNICQDGVWSVIFDIIIVIVLEQCEPHSYRTANIIDNHVCSGCSSDQLFPQPFPLSFFLFSCPLIP